MCLMASWCSPTWAIRTPSWSHHLLATSLHNLLFQQLKHSVNLASWPCPPTTTNLDTFWKKPNYTEPFWKYKKGIASSSDCTASGSFWWNDESRVTASSHSQWNCNPWWPMVWVHKTIDAPHAWSLFGLPLVHWCELLPTDNKGIA